MSINTLKYIEEYIKIRDKSGRIIPLKLNSAQLKLYNIIKEQKKANKPVRIIILKARQMGFSTLTEAVLFKETATKRNIRTGIIAHKEDSTANLFNMSKLMFEHLPEPIKPHKKASNAKELIFDNESGTGLKSKFKCMTAGGKGVGRSDTFNALHLSELAFWECDKKKALTGIFQAVPNLPNTIIIIESTANGYEYYKELWDRAVAKKSEYIALFVGWNEMQEYKMPYTGFKLTVEEQELQKLYNLTLEQLSWRRWCIENNCGGDIEQFKQEYPINPQEAFISTGQCIFNKEKIINRIQNLERPYKQGYFTYNYDGLKVSNIKWNNDTKNGYIKIYEIPDSPEISQYCIGGDTAGEGSDYFTGQVLNAKNGKLCATLRQQMDADLYTKQMYCLGKYYKDALIGIESNFDSFPNAELQRIGYKNLYVREKTDDITHKKYTEYGFKTTLVTRPLIISNLVEIVREHIEQITDKETLEEMLTFVKNAKGRAEAQLRCP